MSKAIHINDSGYVWSVPLSEVAKHRADFYSSGDSDTTFDEEFKFVMEDEYEGLDWFLNNMDFADVKDVAVLIKTPEPLQEPRINTGHCKCEIAQP